jgi:hypothetical protein
MAPPIPDTREISASRAAEIAGVFRGGLPLLREVFREYGIPAATARSAESDLTSWFVRFCRRNPDMGAEAQLLALLSLACSFSRGYARLQSEESPVGPDTAALLRKDPEAVARRIASAAGVTVSGTPAASPWARLLAFARGGRR